MGLPPPNPRYAHREEVYGQGAAWPECSLSEAQVVNRPYQFGTCLYLTPNVLMHGEGRVLGLTCTVNAGT